MMDENKPFINRRGHRLDVSDDELNSLRLDDEPVQMPATAPAAPPRPALPEHAGPRRSRPALTFRFPKRATLVIAGLIVGAAILFVALGEFVRAQYSGAESETRQTVQRIAATTTRPQKEATTLKAGDLDTPIKELSSAQADLCRGGFLDNATGLYPRAQAALGECNRSKQRLTALIADLQATQQQLAYLESVEKVLVPIKASKDGQFAVISAQLESWQRVGADLQKLQAPAAMTQVHADLTKSASAVYESWSALNTAYNAQDAEAFTAAQDQLNAQYTSFRSHAAQLQDVVGRTQAELNASYEAAIS